MKIKILLLQIFLIGFIFSCKKDQPVVTPSWGKEVFIQNDWVITSIIIKQNTTDPYAIANNDVTVSNVFEDYDDCVKDDVYKFNPDSSWEILPGANNCGGSSTITREWAVSEQGDLLLISRNSNGEISSSFTYPLLDFESDNFTIYIINPSSSSNQSVQIIKFESI